jgi:hypothetical protein
MPELTVADLITLGGATIVVTLVVELIKRATAWDAAFNDRFVPLLAVFVGIAIGGGAALYLGADPVQAGLNGLLAGCASQGLHQVLAKVRPAA